MNWAKVIGLESALKMVFQFGDEPNVASSDKDVVDVDEDAIVFLLMCAK